MGKTLEWIYAGSGKMGQEDTEWRLVSAGLIADWFDIEETATCHRDLGYRVRVYMCVKGDKDAALKG